MLNNVVLVGRIAKEIELRTLESGKKVTNVTIAVPRSFKNAEGLYDTDFISCVLWDSIASNTSEYCNKGDIIGIKGRLQCNDETEYRLELVAEKVTFLSSKSKEEK